MALNRRKGDLDTVNTDKKNTFHSLNVSSIRGNSRSGI